MKWYEKALLAGLAIFAILSGIGMLCAAIGFPFALHILSRAADGVENAGTALAVSLCSVALMAAAVRVLYAAFHKPAREVKLTVAENEAGCVYITEPAIIGMADRFAFADESVRRCRTSLRIENGVACLTLRVTAKSEEPVADVGQRLENGVKTYVETYGGVNVGSVSVIVEAAEPRKTPSRVA